MEGIEDSGAQEIAGENESADAVNEPAERTDRGYTVPENPICKPNRMQERASAAERIRKISGLEKAVSESKGRAVKVDANSREHKNAKISRNLAESVAAMDSAAYEEEGDTPNGAVAVIYRKDKKTGNLEFLFEEKPFDYPVPEARGKLSFVGGAIKRGEISLEALARELAEEIEEPAAAIVLKSLETNGSFYRRLPYEYKGTRGYIDIYAIEIKQKSDWDVVRWTAFKHDAGFPRVLAQSEMRVDDFAFGYGEIAKRFTGSNLGFDVKKFTPFTYSDSIFKASSQLPSSDLSKYSLVRM